MACLDEDLISAFVDGQLDDDRAAQVEAHADGCPACLALLAALARQRAAAPPASLPFDPTTPGVSGALDPAAPRRPVSQRFVLRRLLGEGGFGAVYEALDRERNTVVALKILQHASADALYSFKQEFRSLQGLLHPNLVTLYELLTDGDQWYFTMELLVGMDLLDYVRGGRRGETPPPSPVEASPIGALDPTLAPGGPPSARPAADPPHPPAALQLDVLCAALLQLAQGLRVLHQAGKLHRDIKPSNLLCTPQGRLVILDFGMIAELATQQRGQVSHVIRGTAAYMSPEQAMGRPLSEASDWYSVGATLYQALTGQLPFTGEVMEVLLRKQQEDPPPPSHLVPGVPGELEALCMDLLRRAPAERPAGSEVVRRLLELCRRFPLPASPGAPLPRPHPRDPVVIGRRPQVEALLAAFQASRRRAVTVLCHGGSGMGKSTLVRHFLHQLGEQEPQAVLLQGRCYEHEEVPFKALDGIVDALSRLLGRLPEAQALLPRHVHALARLFPVLAQVPAVRQAPLREIADERQARRAAFDALRELLLRLTDRRPVVLFIDDLQWGDLDSVALLGEVLCLPEPPALLLIVAYRTQEAGSSPVLGEFLGLLRGQRGTDLDVREVQVDALASSESEALLRALLPEHGTTRERLEAVAAEAQGHPFLLTELAWHLAQRAPLADPPASSTATVEALVRARVERLPAEAQRLLEAVAVAGQPLPRTLARQAAWPAGSDAQEAHEPQALALLRSSHLVRIRRVHDREELEPYHDRIRETVVAQLPPAVLREQHRRLALALERSGQAETERLSFHFQQAGERAQAARYAIQAAAQAHKALAFDRAARLCRAALEIGELDEEQVRWLLGRLGEALVGAGRPGEAAAAYLQAAEREAPAQALWHRRQALGQLLFGGYAEAGQEVLQQVLSQVGLRLPASPLGALLSLLALRLWFRLRGLRFRERPEDEVPAAELLRIDTCWSVAAGLGAMDAVRAGYFQARHLQHALRAGEPDRMARALAVEAAYAGLAGTRSGDKADLLLQRAEALAERTGHPYSLGYVAFITGFIAVRRGAFGPGIEHLRRGEEILRERCTGVFGELDYIHMIRAHGLWLRGQVQELAGQVPAVIRDAAERGSRYCETMVRLIGGVVVDLAAGQVEQARDTARAAMAGVAPRPVLTQHYFELAAQVHIALYQGQGPRAWQLLSEGGPLLSGHLRMEQMNRVQFRYLHALAALALDDEAGQRIAARDARLLGRERAAWADALALLLRAGVAQRRGQAAGAGGLLQAAEAALQAADMGLYAAAARRRRGEWLGGAQGAALIESAEAWMTGQLIREPARMTDLLVPVSRP